MGICCMMQGTQSWCSVMTQRGGKGRDVGEQFKRGRCMAETITILSSNYPPIKNKIKNRKKFLNVASKPCLHSFVPTYAISFCTKFLCSFSTYCHSNFICIYVCIFYICILTIRILWIPNKSLFCRIFSTIFKLTSYYPFDLKYNFLRKVLSDPLDHDSHLCYIFL